MNNIDLTAILHNLAQSLLSVELLIEGLGYILGISLIVTGLFRLPKHDLSHEGAVAPIAYILCGAFLVYLPNSMSVISNTLFGKNNILQYSSFTTFSLYDSMGVLIQTAGLVWFVRGATLLARASEPGKQEGIKGLLFVVAGACAMNFTVLISAFNYLMNYFLTFTNHLS